MTRTKEQKTSDKGARDCPAGTVLFREGEDGKRMYVIQSGRVRLTKKVCDAEIVVEDLGAGEFCGELAMVVEQARPVTAMVIEDAAVIPVDTVQFESMIRGNTEIALRMMKKLSQRLTQAQYRVSNLVLRTTKARVLHQLRSEVQARSPEDLRAPTPIPDNLADALAIEIGELKKILGQFVREELITLDKRGFYQIVDLDAFDRYLRYLELHDRFEYA